eukprot:s3215_g6.t2
MRDPSWLSPIGSATKSIQAAGRQKQWKEAVATYDQLKFGNLETDAICCGAVLQACQASAWHLAYSMFWQVQEASMQLSVICCNIAASFSGQQESWHRTIGLLLWMSSMAMRPDSQSYAPALSSMTTWTQSLQLLHQAPPNRILSNVAMATIAGAWQRCFDIFYDLRAARPLPDTIFLNTFLSSLERSCHWQLAVSMLQTPPESSLKPNRVSFNACLHACGEAEQLDQALQLLKSMEDHGRWRPDVISYSAVLSACARLAQWTLALDELGRMQRRHVLPDVVALNAAMSACAEAVQWEMCLRMLQTSSARDADTISYNAFLKACDKSAQWMVALSVHAQMLHVRTGCTTTTYNTLLSCCQRSSQWVHATRLLAMMTSQHCLADVISFNACLGALRRGSRWQHALAVLDAMTRSRVRSDAVTLVEALGTLAEGEAPARLCLAPSLARRIAESVRDCMEPSVQAEASRPSGLAVTACDALASQQLPETFESQCLLRRYALRPALRALRGAGLRLFGSRVLRLRNPALERQHSLGASLTKEALLELEGRSVRPFPPPWMLGASQAARSLLARAEVSSLATREPTSQTIVAWLAHRLARLQSCRGRLGGVMKEDPPSLGAYLRPVQVEHDRSSHAERQALLSLLALESAGVNRDGSLDFSGFSGTVRLYVTHTAPPGTPRQGAAAMKLLLRLLSPMDSFCCGCSLDFGIKLILLYQTVSCAYELCHGFGSLVLEVKSFGHSSLSSEAFSMFCALASIPFVVAGWSGLAQKIETHLRLYLVWLLANLGLDVVMMAAAVWQTSCAAQPGTSTGSGSAAALCFAHGANMSISVEVRLLSGRTTTVIAGLDEDVDALKCQAQTAFGVGKGRLVHLAGSVLDVCVPIRDSKVRDGDLLTLQRRQVGLRGSSQAFAAILGDGSVVTWGHAGSGGDSSAIAAVLGDGSVVTWGDASCGGDTSAVQSQLTNVQHIQATETAFAAILGDGSVVTWGDALNGGDSTAVHDQLTNVLQIQASDEAFAAILGDGSVVTWGDPVRGGDCGAVQDQLKNVQQIQASAGAFAAILGDGSVVTWGDETAGGDSSAVQDQLNDVLQIQATFSAFAAILGDGSVVTWGDACCAGDTSAVQSQLTNVQQIQASVDAFAAILGDGSVVTWGDARTGGDSTHVHEQLNNVQQIHATDSAFAAILADGSVVTWGNARFGGDGSAVKDRLKNVQQIQASTAAFAAILGDGSVVAWGDETAGGDSSAVQDQLKTVQEIQAAELAFAAILGDGSVVTWGDARNGGDSTAVQEQLNRV